MSETRNVFQQAADLLNSWGSTRLYDGNTLDELLTFDGISLWETVAPVLAAFNIPKALASQLPPSYYNKAIRPYLLLTKYRLKSCASHFNNANKKAAWPPVPAPFFLGFSGYMYRDILEGVRNKLSESLDVNSVVLHDDERLQESKVELQGTNIHSIWECWDSEVKEFYLSVRNELNKKITVLKHARSLSTLSLCTPELQFEKIEAIMNWLSIYYLPALLPYFAVSKQMLVKHRPSILISPDVADPRARLLCQAGKSIGIPSLTLQFGMYGSEAVEWCFFLEDMAAVWGGSGRKVLMEHGVPSERITITGSPRFDMLAGSTVSSLRKRLGIADYDRVILFASVYSPKSDKEYSSLKNVITDVKRAVFSAADRVDKIILLVKPHPLENVKETKRIAKGYKNIIFVDQKLDIRELIKSSDAFITLGSTSTMDALIANKLIIFPAFEGLVWQEDLYLKSQVAHAVTTEDELIECFKKIADATEAEIMEPLKPAIKAFLEDQIYRADGLSAQRVANLVMQMMPELSRNGIAEQKGL